MNVPVPVEDRAFIAWFRTASNEDLLLRYSELYGLSVTDPYARKSTLCDLAELRIDLQDARAQVGQRDEEIKRLQLDVANGVTVMVDAVAERDATIQALGEQLEHDRSLVADCITKATKAVNSRDWLTEGRGPYEWDDDNWHSEFAAAAKEYIDAVEPMRKVAADWSGCPMDAKAVAAARIDLKATILRMKSESLPAAVASQPPCNRCRCPALNHCGTGCLSGSRTSSACTCPLTLTQVIAQGGALDSATPQATLSTSELEGLREEVERLKFRTGNCTICSHPLGAHKPYVVTFRDGRRETSIICCADENCYCHAEADEECEVTRLRLEVDRLSGANREARRVAEHAIEHRWFDLYAMTNILSALGTTTEVVSLCDSLRSQLTACQQQLETARSVIGSAIASIESCEVSFGLDQLKRIDAALSPSTSETHPTQSSKEPIIESTKD